MAYGSTKEPEVQSPNEPSLIALIEKECGFYRVLLELSKNERHKFQAHRPLSEILPIMKKKKIILSCIQETEEKLIPLRSEWEKNTANLQAHNHPVNKHLRNMAKLITEILDYDQENHSLLARYMKALEERELELRQEEESP